MPISLAVQNTNVEILYLLFAAGASIELRTLQAEHWAKILSTKQNNLQESAAVYNLQDKIALENICSSALHYFISSLTKGNIGSKHADIFIALIGYTLITKLPINDFVVLDKLADTGIKKVTPDLLKIVRDLRAHAHEKVSSIEDYITDSKTKSGNEKENFKISVEKQIYDSKKTLREKATIIAAKYELRTDVIAHAQIIYTSQTLTIDQINQFCEALLSPDLEQLEQLIIANPQIVNYPINQKGENALIFAVSEQKSPYIIEKIKLLLKYGANPNQQNFAGLSSLHFICTTNGPKTIEILAELLKKGANPNLVNFAGDTPGSFISWHSKKSSLEVNEQKIKLLLEYGFNPNHFNKITNMYLVDMVWQFLDIADEKSASPTELLIISEKRNLSLGYKFDYRLVCDKSKIEILNKLRYAFIRKDEKLISAILDCNFDPNFITSDGTAIEHTIIHSIAKQNFDINDLLIPICRLIKIGANPCIRTSFGIEPNIFTMPSFLKQIFDAYHNINKSRKPLKAETVDQFFSALLNFALESNQQSPLNLLSSETDQSTLDSAALDFAKLCIEMAKESHSIMPLIFLKQSTKDLVAPTRAEQEILKNMQKCARSLLNSSSLKEADEILTERTQSIFKPQPRIQKTQIEEMYSAPSSSGHRAKIQRQDDIRSTLIGASVI